MGARLTALALSAVLCAVLVIAHSRAATIGAPSGTVAQLDMLPPALRPHGQALLDQRDARQRARLAGELSRGHAEEASEFLLAVLATDPSPQVRSAIVGRLGRHASPAFTGVRPTLAEFDAEVGTGKGELVGAVDGAVVDVQRVAEAAIWSTSARS